MKIKWKKPGLGLGGYLGKIVAEDGGSILIQSNQKSPRVAMLFGWRLQSIQLCPVCGELITIDGRETKEGRIIGSCDDAFWPSSHLCKHSSTDGTIDCPECGITATQFITEAVRWLNKMDGKETERSNWVAVLQELQIHE